MKRWILVATLALLPIPALGQSATILTGTVITYGTGFNTRTQTRNFTLRIKGETSDTDAQRLVGILQARGQDKLLDEIRHNDLGTLSLGGNVGQTINAVRIEHVGDTIRLRAVLARWLGFGELRGGYRSLDYPFSYIELRIDPRTGKGDGTFFSAAQIKFKNNDIQIEDFGTFPGKMLNVRVTGRPLP